MNEEHRQFQELVDGARRAREAMPGYLDRQFAKAIEYPCLAVLIHYGDGERDDAFARATAKYNAVYLSCLNWRTAKQFLVTMAEAARLSPLKMTAAQLHERLVDYLLDTERPVFIDDAERLRATQWHALMDLYRDAGFKLVLGSSQSRVLAMADIYSARLPGGVREFSLESSYAQRHAAEHFDDAQDTGVIGRIGFHPPSNSTTS